MKKKFWTSDKLVGLVAILISLITLIIFVRQTNIMEKQSRLSVMPYLMISKSDIGSENTHSFALINYGVGPAIIDSTLIFYKERIHHNMEFVDFLKAEIREIDSIPILNRSTVTKGLAIPAGGERNFLTVGGNKKTYKAFSEVYEELNSNGFYFEIYYRSIYDDKWRITSETDLPQELKD
ncbi:hypothetical protein [Flagellimonas pacifica]|uniref:Uncharacterized protein n=1 Tax=Flagellimonas pacifica TaxID=1247520 RepID=A0A285MTQ3_9FLAO|nr:hypothetical protein [Allomuricauda parva]SNY99917.1 hypothetical protein SAMN06265377_1731 [Allomuricauda parva]